VSWSCVDCGVGYRKERHAGEVLKRQISPNLPKWELI
jgi:hypothetical protein